MASPPNDDNPSFETCTKCGGESFHVWAKWGLWYAVCTSCMNEYGLQPKGVFVLLREPSEEEHGYRTGQTP